MKGKITMAVGMDVQVAYDHAKAMSEAWAAMAESLASLSDVCDHPEEAVQEVDGVGVCANCGRVP